MESILKDLNNKQAIIHIDATPDENYVLRILQAYRENCGIKFATELNGECNNPLYQQMNNDQDKRAKLLDEAIIKLTR